MKEQLEGELKQLNSSLAQLTVAANKFGFSEESVRAICPDNADKPLIVPLTSSLYITGQVGDVTKVMVDVGTGYFIEKSPAAATDL